MCMTHGWFLVKYVNESFILASYSITIVIGKNTNVMYAVPHLLEKVYNKLSQKEQIYGT